MTNMTLQSLLCGVGLTVEYAHDNPRDRQECPLMSIL